MTSGVHGVWPTGMIRSPWPLSVLPKISDSFFQSSSVSAIPSIARNQKRSTPRREGTRRPSCSIRRCLTDRPIKCASFSIVPATNAGEMILREKSKWCIDTSVKVFSSLDILARSKWLGHRLILPHHLQHHPDRQGDGGGEEQGAGSRFRRRRLVQERSGIKQRSADPQAYGAMRHTG